jgi:hypothetical protein
MIDNKVISCGLLLCFILISCDSKKRNEREAIDNAEQVIEEKPEKPITITLVEPRLEEPVSRTPLVPPPLISPLQPNLAVPPVGLVLREEPDDDNDCHCEKDCDLGNAGFSTTSPDNWFEIQTQVYPETVLLSQGRNNGLVQGDVSLTPTGLKVNESGTYWASFSAVLLNNNPEYTPLIPIFLVQNGQFSPSDGAGTLLGATVSLPPNYISTAQGSGPLTNVQEGTILSILATNGGSPQPEPVTVVSWNMSIYKICD